MSLSEFIRKAVKCLVNPEYRFWALNSRGFYDSMPDEEFLKRVYEYMLGKKLNLINPETFTEKMQWQKLYDRRPEYTKMADKYEVKSIVAAKIGSEHVIPLIGVWDNFDDIDIDSLPSQFVLKCTHDSGGLIVCRDKSEFDIQTAREKLTRSLRTNYYKPWREWAYKDIHPRIIAEKYIDSLGKPDSLEYKLTCFGGRVRLITICRGIAHSSFDVRTNDHYDRDLNRLNFWVNYRNPKVPEKIPEQMNDIIAFSEKLSEGFPQVRVDWYILDGCVYFGEMTFYTWAGFMKFNPPEWDYIMGSWFELPPDKHC
ncbi:MAG: hypothetical protein IJL01_06090 [Synergistaceae bacterium]|nr:hypothetical protein [Synergistaceae bacterium]